MTCRLDACSQGRCDCPAPDICGDDRLTTPEEMSAAGAFLGLIAIAVLVGLVGFAVYTIAPLFASFH